jgi:hypothetical protein
MVVKRYHIIIYGFENSGTVPEFCQTIFGSGIFGYFRDNGIEMLTD